MGPVDAVSVNYTLFCWNLALTALPCLLHFAQHSTKHARTLAASPNATRFANVAHNVSPISPVPSICALLVSSTASKTNPPLAYTHGIWPVRSPSERYYAIEIILNNTSCYNSGIWEGVPCAHTDCMWCDHKAVWRMQDHQHQQSISQPQVDNA